MRYKITLVQDCTDPNKWHWIILGYEFQSWCNVSSSLEDSYEIACIKAKQEYDRLMNK